MFDRYIEVKDSGIHGSGLFASTNIPVHSKIMIISGEVIDDNECVRREEEENNVYIFWNEKNYIDTAKSDKIKFINHSCEYNCEVEERDEHTLWLVAAKNILAGEELTIDYGYDEIYDYCSCSECENKN
jgi:hypothetical protein